MGDDTTTGRTVNKVILVGHAGRDPERVELADGKVRAVFSLATRCPDGDKGHITDWHRLTLYGNLATFAEEYIKKGDRIYVEGRIHYDCYERDGITIPTAEVVVREVVLLSPLNKEGPNHRSHG